MTRQAGRLRYVPQASRLPEPDFLINPIKIMFILGYSSVFLKRSGCEKSLSLLRLLRFFAAKNLPLRLGGVSAPALHPFLFWIKSGDTEYLLSPHSKSASK